MLISFKCGVCANRTSGLMSRQAYERGVVIIRCKSCDNLHLVADHLGWIQGTDQKGWNIERALAERGEAVARLDIDNVVNIMPQGAGAPESGKALPPPKE